MEIVIIILKKVKFITKKIFRLIMTCITDTLSNQFLSVYKSSILYAKFNNEVVLFFLAISITENPTR